jgi:hypothetical protein
MSILRQRGPVSSLVLVVDDGPQHRQLQVAVDVLLALDSGVQVLQQKGEADADHETSLDMETFSDGTRTFVLYYIWWGYDSN